MNVRDTLFEALPNERLAHFARQIHVLGPRPLYELFVELAVGKPLLETLERYAALETLSGFIRSNNGSSLPPLRPIGGRDAA
jgi:hypothetical protein